MTIDDVAKAVADALDVAGIEFMLTGALASAYYGLSRSTMDADFLVQYDRRQRGRNPVHLLSAIDQ